ncbi:hypothetical protein [Streptomyces sp. NRRL S-813]|uniref:hypothetical protein n=1 Tax=Streptomyces sp. NRRL S-813 TaxID=1463919 RepID=UPI0004C128D5|nr:hypothetical protein [Streptomyces sp. NRRL S-813]
MTRPISALDVPLPVVEAEAERLWQERDRRIAALQFRQAAERATDPKDQLVYRLDARLVRHPELLATDDTYPGFAEWIAAREADNRRARTAKETNR